MTVIEIIVSPLLALLIGILFLGISRKVMARIHWRYGPPLAQPVIDIIKLFSQRGISHGRMFDLGLVLSLTSVIVLILFLPLGTICPLQGSGGMLVILYLMLLGPLGIALSSGESANPNASIGVSRKLILALGYEVPFLLVILSVMTHYGTISIMEIVRLQQGAVWSVVSWPLLLSGIAYILILPAVIGIRPFDFVTAPQEISSGPMVEYSGQFLALAKIHHALSLFVGISLFTNLFLGGAGNPLTFFLKMLVVFMLCLMVNAAMPRLRVDQAIRYLWRWPTLFALGGLIAVMIIGR